MKDSRDSIPTPGGLPYTGAVFTPGKVADSVVSQCFEILGGKSVSVLEPSAGDGAFLKSLSRSEIAVQHATAIDIDKDSVHLLNVLAEDIGFPVEIFCQDFLCNVLEGGISCKPDLIIGNPPFIRRRNFSDRFKLNCDALEEWPNSPSGVFKNSWPAFLVASESLLSENGILAFVLPYELLTVSYGQATLCWAMKLFSKIDIYVSKDRAFPEIDQDAVVFIAQKADRGDEGAFINNVSSFEDLRNGEKRELFIGNAADRGLDFSSFLIDEVDMSFLRELRGRCDSLSDYATSSPGVVTAANDFFIRSREDVDALSLNEYATPVLKRGSSLTSVPVYREADYEGIADTEANRFLEFRGALEGLSKAAQSYIFSGEADGLHLRYKCRKRRYWYQVDRSAVKPGFIFKRCHSHPRLIINSAGVLTTDSAYGVVPVNGATMKGLCFSFYNSLTMLFAEMDGRFYGGGVLELSPREFRGLPLVYVEPTEEQFLEFLEVHSGAGSDPLPVLDFGDRWLADVMNLDDLQLKSIRKSWDAVRSHRLRHGGRSFF